MKNNKITSHPPVSNSANDFILAAEDKNSNLIKRSEFITYPWLKEGIRDDVQKVFTVKLQEEYTLKIKYISDVTNKSQQKIIREIINTSVDDLLKLMKIKI